MKTAHKIAFIALAALVVIGGINVVYNHPGHGIIRFPMDSVQLKGDSEMVIHLKGTPIKTTRFVIDSSPITITSVFVDKGTGYLMANGNSFTDSIPSFDSTLKRLRRVTTRQDKIIDSLQRELGKMREKEWNLWQFPNEFEDNRDIVRMLTQRDTTKMDLYPIPDTVWGFTIDKKRVDSVLDIDLDSVVDVTKSYAEIDKDSAQADGFHDCMFHVHLVNKQGRPLTGYQPHFHIIGGSEPAYKSAVLTQIGYDGLDAKGDLYVAVTCIDWGTVWIMADVNTRDQVLVKKSDGWRIGIAVHFFAVNKQ